MRIYVMPEKIRMPEGTKVTIRAFEPADSSLLQEFFRRLPEADRMYLRDDVTRDNWIDHYLWKLSQDYVVPIIAMQNGKVVAKSSHYRRSSGWSSHVGEIRVAVAPSHQGQGLARKLVRPLVRAGMTLGLDQLAAHIVDNQTPARRLLEGLGFKQDAVLTGRVRDAQGTKRDLIIMCNEISHVWDAMGSLVSDFLPVRHS